MRSHKFREYTNPGFLDIEQLASRHKITVRVETFVGAYNSPYDIGTIVIYQNLDGVKVLNFKHSDA